MTTAIVGTGGIGSAIARELADQLAGQLVVVPSNPITADAHGNIFRLLPPGQSAGEVVAGWLPAGAHLAMAFGTLPADLLESSIANPDRPQATKAHSPNEPSGIARRATATRPARP